jgi:hypothetical protein
MTRRRASRALAPLTASCDANKPLLSRDDRALVRPIIRELADRLDDQAK